MAEKVNMHMACTNVGKYLGKEHVSVLRPASVFYIHKMYCLKKIFSDLGIMVNAFLYNVSTGDHKLEAGKQAWVTQQ